MSANQGMFEVDFHYSFMDMYFNLFPNKHVRYRIVTSPHYDMAIAVHFGYPDLAQGENFFGQGLQRRLLLFPEELQRSHMSCAMITHSCCIHDPGSQSPIRTIQVQKLLTCKEIPFHISHSVFYFSFQPWRCRGIGTHQKMVMLCKLPVSFPQDGIL